MLLSHSAAALRFHACMCDVFRHSVCKVCSKIVRCSFPQLLSSMLCWWWWQACRHGHWLVEISFIEPFPFVLPLLLTVLMAQLLYRVGMHDINRTDRVSADMGKITFIFICPIKDFNRLFCLIHLWNRKIVCTPSSTKTGQVAWVMFSIGLFSILAGGGLLLLCTK